ncbi:MULTISPECIES: transposase [unclassified Janthinobacterium]|uniref:transposase n=1 Tax=unclassified Janthinobacterium TaxID=2610881 RepID=UPI001614BDA4|nr:MULTISPECIES: transposase [unclassified Janthinobacterium]MBB5610985.1 REP element-mobilizing transposase RayT [Janthinobacterium sp. S3T4]MBB5616478.1 REP element-mobilizing transposase RayT [Janthinobacterium sp. S3M3]
MTRPLRLEFAGALYHITSRGDRCGTIYRDVADRLAWLDLLALVCERHHFVVHSFCQMSNHYHLLVETAEANLSQGMRQLNGLYSQYFNRRHKLVGHVYQGRYKAILVQKESYLLELARYIVLNPVRAHMVPSADDWNWSSHHYFLGDETPPCWLACDWLLSKFGHVRNEAVLKYDLFINAGIEDASPLTHTCHQLLLGDEAFVAAHQQSQYSGELIDTAKTQRRAVTLSLTEYQTRYSNRDEAMARAYLSTAYTMLQIGLAFGVSTRTVSRALASFEKSIIPKKAE